MDNLDPKSAKGIKIILNLWQYRVPTKVIAEALNISYATVATYTRSFKGLYKQRSAQQVVISVLHNINDNNNINNDNGYEDSINE